MALTDTAPQQPLADSERPHALGRRVFTWLGDNAILSVLILLVVVIAVINPRFLSITVLRDILVQSSTRTVIALGAFFAVLTAGCDLSAGRQVGFAAVLSASMLQVPDYGHLFFGSVLQLPLFVPLLLAVLACALCGLINGAVVAKLGVSPFIATLGSMVAVYGLNSIYFNMSPNDSQPIGGLRPDFTALGTGSIGTGPWSVPYILLIAVAVSVFMWLLMNKTTFGKHTYAIGGNTPAARVAGINVTRTTLIMYTLAGALFGVGGFLEAARTGGATNNYGSGYEFDAIAACVVGGVSVTGGVGKVPGILIGVLVFGVMNYALTFVGLSSYWQLIIKGTIIVAAVSLDVHKYAARK